MSMITTAELVFSTSAYDYREDMKYKDTMYFLDKRTGELLNSTHVPPIPPFDNTVMRGSPNYSAGWQISGSSGQ